MRKTNIRVGVVGCTGLVGREILKVLEERDFPVGELCLLASERSEGQRLAFQGKEVSVETLSPEIFQKKALDIVLFAASGGVAAEYAPKAAASGATVIDNSSHFRMDEAIPLIVPEVNPEALSMAESDGIIANPNCSTIQMVVCLKPLDEAFGLKRVVVSTYQSVSGAGQDAMDEMQTQVAELLAGRPVNPNVFARQIAFNCLPHIDTFLEDGHTKEEMKMIRESKKIMSRPDLRIAATAVRVPTFISHAESINCEFEKPVDVQKARKILESAEGVIVADDINEKLYPTPFEAAGKDEVFVGRIRKDESVENGLYLWIVADNLRKGAATNAVQIAELCVEKAFRSLSRPAA